MELIINNDHYQLSYDSDNIVENKRRLNKFKRTKLEFSLNGESDDWINKLILPEIITIDSFRYNVIIINPVILNRKKKTYNYSGKIYEYLEIELSFEKLLGSHDENIIKLQMREYKLSKLGI